MKKIFLFTLLVVGLFSTPVLSEKIRILYDDIYNSYNKDEEDVAVENTDHNEDREENNKDSSDHKEEQPDNSHKE